jgi:hypothetical protein
MELTWAQWKKQYQDKLAHVAGFEERFVDDILCHIPEISPNDVHPQYHFIDSKGINRYIDFVVINTEKGYFLPIELDGYHKIIEYGGYEKFNDLLERQNDLLQQFGVLLRYTNRKAFSEKKAVIKEIRHVLYQQAHHQLDEQSKQRQMKALIADYQQQLDDYKEKVSNSSSDTQHILYSIQQMQRAMDALKQQQEAMSATLQYHQATLTSTAKTSTTTSPATTTSHDTLTRRKGMVWIKGLVAMVFVSFGLYWLIPTPSSLKKQNANSTPTSTTVVDTNNFSVTQSDEIPPLDSGVAESVSATSTLHHPVQEQPTPTNNEPYTIPEHLIDKEEDLGISSISSESTPIKAISAKEAVQHVGEYKTVCDQVSQVSLFSQGVYINFGGNYPQQLFTAVVWQQGEWVESLKQQESKPLCIEGNIILYKGKPQITVESSHQIHTPVGVE